MTTHSQLEEYILELPDTWKDFPFGKDVAVYRHGPEGDADSKMFALIKEKSDPVRLSVKCDPQLAVILREKYETVLPGYHLNKKNWNTILCTGQVPDDEIQGFILHSYQLVKG